MPDLGVTPAPSLSTPLPASRWKALDEIHGGACDGLSYAQIEQRFPEEYAARGADKLRYRCGAQGVGMCGGVVCKRRGFRISIPMAPTSCTTGVGRRCGNVWVAV